MPVRPLPLKLIKRLKKVVPQIGRALGHMENIDHRKNRIATTPRDTTRAGGRIREINVSKTFPGENVVIKRTHESTAKETIRIITSKVREHNKKHSSENYVLLEPHAYAIGKDLIAMAKTNAPSIPEILGGKERGLKFLEEWEPKHYNLRRKLKEAKKELYGNALIGHRQVIVLGYKKGKFVFMPLLDLT